MKIINIPGFTAEASFRSTVRLSSARAQHAYNDTRTDQRVIAALPPGGGGTRTDCMVDCIDRCVESGKSIKQCQASCGKYCSSGYPTYQCTNQDNSFNHYSCLAGIGAWGLACNAECGLLSAIPFVGGLLAGACTAGCDALVTNMNATCPPAVICV